MYYFLDVADLEPDFKHGLLYRLSETYPCFNPSAFLEKDWWVLGGDRLLYSSAGPDPDDTRLTWDRIRDRMFELEFMDPDPPETTSTYSMFVDADEVEF